MNFIIKSHKYGKISFFMPAGGGYIYLESAGKEGTLGKQICKGGGFTGSTISATTESFEAVCRRWHRQRMAYIRKDGGFEYGN